MNVVCIDVATALLMQIYLAGRVFRLKLIGQGWPQPRAVYGTAIIDEPFRFKFYKLVPFFRAYAHHL